MAPASRKASRRTMTPVKETEDASGTTLPADMLPLPPPFTVVGKHSPPPFEVNPRIPVFSNRPLEPDADISRPRLEVDRSGKLLNAYITEYGITRPAIAAYNWWVQVLLPRFLEDSAIEIPLGRFHFESIRAVPPTTSVGPGANKYKPLLPSSCRQSGTNYSFTLFADIVFTPQGSRKTVRTTSVKIGEIPIMLGSKLDNNGTTCTDPAECHSNPLGYFIVRGTEKSILLKEKLRPFKMILYHDSSVGVQVKMTTPTSRGSKQVMVYAKDKDPYNILISPQVMNPEIKEGKINKDSDMSFFIVFRILGKFIGKTTYEEFKSMIDPFVTPAARVAVRNLLLISEYRDRKNLDPYVVLMEFRRNNSMQTKSIHEVNQLLLDGLFTNITLNRVTGETEGARMHRAVYFKLMTLAAMVAKLCEFLVGVRKLDNRDSWSNKTVVNPAKAMETLFSVVFNDVVKLYTTDKKKESHRSMPNKFVEGLGEDLSSQITEAFASSIGGNSWGVGRHKRLNVVQSLSVSNNLQDKISLLTQVSPPHESGKHRTKTSALREVQMDQVGFICLADTPEGDNCGLVKHLACTCSISLERDDAFLISVIYANSSLDETPAQSSPVFLDGRFCGWCDAPSLYATLKQIKRTRTTAERYEDICVVITQDGKLEVSSDGGRLIRPLLVVGEDGVLVIDKKNLWGAPFETLLLEQAVEYLDPYENERAVVAERVESVYETDSNLGEVQSELALLTAVAEGAGSDEVVTVDGVTTSAEAVRKQIRVLRDREAYYLRRRAWQFCEMDPVALMSVTVALLPHANHSQAARVSYAAKMLKQALMGGLTQQENFMPTTAKQLVYPAPSLYMTQMASVVRQEEFPSGMTVKVAFATGGKGLSNQEDNIIVNRRLLDLGGLMMVKIITHRVPLSKPSGPVVEQLGIAVTNPEKLKHFSTVVTDKASPLFGIVREGAKLEAGDVLVAKYRLDNIVNEKKDSSMYVHPDETGVVQRVIKGLDSDGNFVISIKVRITRQLQPGDKLASRYAQKATIGAIVPPEDMPFFLDGTQPDFILNPHSIPSRMTMGLLMEILTSKAMTMTGDIFNCTSFREYDPEAIRRQLRLYGMNPSGEDRMVDGRTGRMMQCSVFTGPCYYLVLKHNVLDKIQARGIGKMVTKSRQPVQGRNRGGGLRVGEMERDAFLSHGVAYVAMERLCLSSDSTRFLICTNCGNVAESSSEMQSFKCRKCGVAAQFANVTFPYVFKLFQNYLTGMGMSLTFKMD